MGGSAEIVRVGFQSMVHIHATCNYMIAENVEALTDGVAWGGHVDDLITPMFRA